MKKHVLILIIISFLFSSNRLFALELSIPQCVTNTLMLLKPTNRSVEGTAFPFLKIVNFCLTEQKLLKHCFVAPQWSKTLCCAIVCNRINSIPKIPLLPAVEASMGIAHYLLPCLPGPLFTKNVMISNGRFLFYGFSKNLVKNNFCTLIAQKEYKQAVFLDMCMVGAGVLMTSLAQYNNPELFLTKNTSS